VPVCRIVLAVGVAATFFTAGCAARQAGTPANPFLKTGKPRAEYPAEVNPRQEEAVKAQEQELLMAFELATRSGPPPRTQPPSLESTSVVLKSALHDLEVEDSVRTRLVVAAAYRQLGIRDQAYAHYSAALKLDRRSAAVYDGLARLWRDAGRPELALTEATRAVFYAPHSPEVFNTLGTVLLAAGNAEEAAKAFAKALTLDPSASYALHNATLAHRARQATARPIPEDR
jgi:tetratricopeptide (TPR) repeat protein